jgi:hypothetical protein
MSPDVSSQHILRSGGVKAIKRGRERGPGAAHQAIYLILHKRLQGEMTIVSAATKLPEPRLEVGSRRLTAGG